MYMHMYNDVCCTPKPAHTPQHIQRLAAINRFGRAIRPMDRILLVITDSVMRQMDSLKKDNTVGHAVRRFFREGLEKWGPAGGWVCD